MTGFGQAAGETERHRFSISIKTVNHRLLDVVLRLPDSYRDEEPALRETVAAALHRGRVEARVEIEELGERPCRVQVRRGVVEALRGALEEVAAAGFPAGELQAGDLLRVPELLRITLLPPSWTAADRELLGGLFADALEQVVAARRLEGGKLAEALAGRLEELEGVVRALAEQREAARSAIGESLQARLRELLDGAGLDEDRLAQEVAVLVDRSDVQEELDRLQGHLEHLRSVLGEDGAIGRRLDFLTQEILRELNTLGAKCRDAAMARLVIDAKVLCEQLREQIQNVE